MWTPTSRLLDTPVQHFIHKQQVHPGISQSTLSRCPCTLVMCNEFTRAFTSLSSLWSDCAHHSARYCYSRETFAPSYCRRLPGEGEGGDDDDDGWTQSVETLTMPNGGHRDGTWMNAISLHAPHARQSNAPITASVIIVIRLWETPITLSAHNGGVLGTAEKLVTVVGHTSNDWCHSRLELLFDYIWPSQFGVKTLI